MEGSARVIPAILRPCEWHHAPFGTLLATPADGRPVTKFANLDDAFLEIGKAVRAATTPSSRVWAPASSGPSRPARPALALPTSEAPRSSNLQAAPRNSRNATRIAFSTRASSIWRGSSKTHLPNSRRAIPELRQTSSGSTRRASTRQPIAMARSAPAVRFASGSQLGGITYSYGRQGLMENSINESLSVVVGEQILALHPLGMPMRGKRGEHLSAEGAGEYYWELFIEPLQR